MNLAAVGPPRAIDDPRFGEDGDDADLTGAVLMPKSGCDPPPPRLRP